MESPEALGVHSRYSVNFCWRAHSPHSASQVIFQFWQRPRFRNCCRNRGALMWEEGENRLWF